MKKGITKLLKRLFGILSIDENVSYFPSQGYSRISLYAKLYLTLWRLSKQQKKQQIGWLLSYPTKMTQWVYRHFLQYNPNHLGSHIETKPSLYDTKWFEHSVIKQIIDLYHARLEHLTGYVTSGATEGNILSTWLGREYLTAHHIDSICLLTTSLTHFSVAKAARLTHILQEQIPINKQAWGIDPKGLSERIEELHKKNQIRGFLLPITLGYTQTGTNDDIEQILLVVEQLEKRLGISVFVWIDAATNGLVLPFTNQSFKPFGSKHVQTLLVDFHKFGQMSYPSGICLYRKNLQRYIAAPIPYLPELDVTLLGSRPGISAIAMWALIQEYGIKSFQDIIQKQLILKQHFIDAIKSIFPRAIIISDFHSISCGVIFRDLKQSSLPTSIERAFGLYAKNATYHCANEVVRAKIYKFHFLPHITQRTVHSLLKHLSVECLKNYK